MTVNSVSDLVKYDSLAGRIKLHRQNDRRPIIVTEGNTDGNFLRHVLSSTNVTVFVAGDRRRALRTISELSSFSLEKIACVVDQDFEDDLSALEISGLPIACYDNADMESMIWQSQALESVIRENATQSKFDGFGGIEALRTIASTIVLPIQRLRYANARESLGLDFDALKLDRKISKDTLELPIHSICNALARGDCDSSSRELQEIAEDGEIPICPHSGESLVRGKDLLVVAGVALRRQIGSVSYGSSKADQLALAARLSSNEASLAGTRWRERIRELLDI